MWDGFHNLSLFPAQIMFFFIFFFPINLAAGIFSSQGESLHMQSMI